MLPNQLHQVPILNNPMTNWISKMTETSSCLQFLPNPPTNIKSSVWLIQIIIRSISIHHHTVIFLRTHIRTEFTAWTFNSCQTGFYHSCSIVDDDWLIWNELLLRHRGEQCEKNASSMILDYQESHVFQFTTNRNDKDTSHKWFLLLSCLLGSLLRWLLRGLLLFLLLHSLHRSNLLHNLLLLNQESTENAISSDPLLFNYRSRTHLWHRLPP